MESAFQGDFLERDSPYLAEHIQVSQRNLFYYLYTSKAQELPNTWKKYRKTKNCEKNTRWIPFWASNVLSLQHIRNHYTKSFTWKLLIFLATKQMCSNSLMFFSLYIVINSNSKTNHFGFPESVSISNILRLSPLVKSSQLFIWKIWSPQ